MTAEIKNTLNMETSLPVLNMLRNAVRNLGEARDQGEHELHINVGVEPVMHDNIPGAIISRE